MLILVALTIPARLWPLLPFFSPFLLAASAKSSYWRVDKCIGEMPELKEECIEELQDPKLQGARTRGC
jgi:hypothetical protein